MRKRIFSLLPSFSFSHTHTHTHTTFIMTVKYFEERVSTGIKFLAVALITYIILGKWLYFSKVGLHIPKMIVTAPSSEWDSELNKYMMSNNSLAHFFPTKLLYIFTKITELCSFRSVRDTDLKQPGGVSLLSQSFRDYYVSGACVKHSLSGIWPPDTCFRPWRFNVPRQLTVRKQKTVLKPVSRILLRSREAERNNGSLQGRGMISTSPSENCPPQSVY